MPWKLTTSRALNSCRNKSIWSGQCCVWSFKNFKAVLMSTLKEKHYVKNNWKVRKWRLQTRKDAHGILQVLFLSNTVCLFDHAVCIKNMCGMEDCVVKEKNYWRSGLVSVWGENYKNWYYNLLCKIWLRCPYNHRYGENMSRK